MAFIQIRSHQDGSTLYEGDFQSTKQALERAACEHIDLSHADLRHSNLCGANLDDLCMKNARLDEANLAGANLSECELSGCHFTNAELYNTCFCYSNLSRSTFEGTRFGGTDMTGACLSGTRFSGLSAFSLDFRSIKSLSGGVYRAANGLLCRMNMPPLCLNGLEYPIHVLDEHMLISGIAFHILRPVLTPEIKSALSIPSSFLQEYRQIIGAFLNLRADMVEPQEPPAEKDKSVFS